VNADDIAASINAGDHDDHLETLFKALFARAADIETEFSWKITLDGDSWDRETVTLAELAFAERHLSIPYVQLNPISSVNHLVTLIVAHYHRVKGMKLDEALEAAGKYTARDLVDIISVHEVRQAPKGGQPQPGIS
jgi:hypothetical protein